MPVGRTGGGGITIVFRTLSHAVGCCHTLDFLVAGCLWLWCLLALLGRELVQGQTSRYEIQRHGTEEAEYRRGHQ